MGIEEEAVSSFSPSSSSSSFSSSSSSFSSSANSDVNLVNGELSSTLQNALHRARILEYYPQIVILQEIADCVTVLALRARQVRLLYTSKNIQTFGTVPDYQPRSTHTPTGDSPGRLKEEASSERSEETKECPVSEGENSIPAKDEIERHLKRLRMIVYEGYTGPQPRYMVRLVQQLVKPRR